MAESGASTAPIFVVGTGRSGTSLLRAMLNAHPHIYLVQEANFHAWLGFLGTGRDPEWLLREWFRSFGFAWLRLDAVALREQLPPKLTLEDLHRAYELAMRAKAEEHGARRWGEKNPLLTMSLDVIFERYPDARLVYMVRDPRTNTLSQASMPWSTRSLTAASSMIRDQYDKARPYADRMLFVRLEDLIADPEGQLRRVLDYVGEDFHPAVLDHAAGPPDDGIPFPWLLPASGPRKERPTRKVQALSPAWTRIIEERCAQMMSERGYAVAALPKEPVFGARFFAIVADLPALNAYLLRLLWVALRVRLRPPDTATGQRLTCSTNPSAWAEHPDWTLPEPPEVVLP